MQFTLKRFTVMLLAALVASVGVASAFHVRAEEGDDLTEEPTSDIRFSGQIIELSSTEIPTTIVVRENPTGEFTDYTVEVTASTRVEVDMDDWMVGDYIEVRGERNENTSVVTANRIDSISIDSQRHRGLNGWIDWIAEDGSQIGVQWNGTVTTVNITSNTHLVGNNGPHGTIEDFEVGDRIRVRLLKSSTVENEASIVLILRRGPSIYNLARTRSFYAELQSIDEDAMEMNVLILKNDHLRDGDVNNLIGIEGEEVTVTWDENTSFRRKYLGETGPEEFVPGDRLQIVGRVNDDGTLIARMVRDTNIFRKGVGNHIGKILEVNAAENYIVVEAARSEHSGKREWSIHYDEDTMFYKRDVNEAGEDDLEVGLYVRARGTANNQLLTVDALAIAIYTGDDEGDEHGDRKHARIKDLLDDIRDFRRGRGEDDGEENEVEDHDEDEDESDDSGSDSESDQDDSDEDDSSDDSESDSDDV